MRTTAKTERMTDIDFFMGTLNAATEAEPGLLLKSGDRRIDAAFHVVYRHIVELVDSGEVSDVDPCFAISPDPFHGDSEAVFSGMSFLYSAGYLVKPGTDPYYRFETGRGRTPDELFEQIPSGSPELYRVLGRLFLETLHSEPIEIR